MQSAILDVTWPFCVLEPHPHHWGGGLRSNVRWSS